MWTLDFFDTMLGQVIESMVAQEKWTTATVGPTTQTWEDDAFQVASMGVVNKVLTNTTPGRILGCRWRSPTPANGESAIMTIRKSDDTAALSLQYMENTGELRLYLNDASTITTVGAGIGTNSIHNYTIATLFTGSVQEFETRVDNVQIPELTSTGAGGSATPLTTALTPNISIIATNRGISGTTQNLGRTGIFWSKAYSGSGGIWGSSDFLANPKRGIQRANADGLFAATVSGARWTPDSGANYHSRLSETLASMTQYIKTTTDPNGSPGVLDNASYEMEDVPSTITSILAVQRCTLLQNQTGTSTVKTFTRTKGDTNPANTTYDANYSPSSSAKWKVNLELVDPRDGAAWTRAKMNSIERGIRCHDLV